MTVDNSTPARNAGRTQPNVVVSQDGQIAPAPPATEAPEVKPEGTQEQEKGKNRFSERITELVDKRKAAEEERDSAKRENDDLRMRLERLEASQPLPEANQKPTRAGFNTEDEFIEALTDWKADDALRKREVQQAEARSQAQRQQQLESWGVRQTQAIAEIPDYADVIGASEVVMPDPLMQAIIESEVGPSLAYFFAKHPAEARRLSAMTTTAAIKQIARFERDLMEDEPTPTPAPVERTKAPRPPTPVKDASAFEPGPTKDFESYRAKREAERAAKRR